MALTDYYAAQQLIIDKLADALGIPAFAAAAIEGVFANSNITPAVHVLPYGEEAVDTAYGGSHTVSQRWLVVLAVRNLDDATGQYALLQAGATLLQIQAVLNGWNPSADHGALASVSPPLITVNNGFGYFPLAYACDIEIPGAI